MILEVNQGSLDQIDPATNKILCSYDYKDMEGLIQVIYIVRGRCCVFVTMYNSNGYLEPVLLFLTKTMGSSPGQVKPKTIKGYLPFFW